MESDEYLLISGIQHFSFCRRQWALIHIEQQWNENMLTAEGRILHERVHDIYSSDIRGGVLTMRDLPVKSVKLGITGRCDAVEFIPCNDSDNGVSLSGHFGLWKICPVEYKRGHEKESDCDRLQVIAESMCLEEMFSCEINECALFYYETRKKEKFTITEDLRETVRTSFHEMHEMFLRGYTPTVKKHKGCSNCSLNETCLPSLQIGKGFPSVEKYIHSMLEENY